MRHIILTLSIILLNLFTYSQKIENRVTERIIYTVKFDTIKRIDYPFCYIPQNTKKQIINTFCDLAYNNKVKVYSYYGEIGNLPYVEIRPALVKSYFKWNDTIKFIPDTKKYKNEWDKKRDNQVYRYLINSLSFQEEWYFDETKNEFIKKVNGVFLYQDEYTHNIGMKESFYLKFNTTENEYDSSNIIVEDII